MKWKVKIFRHYNSRVKRKHKKNKQLLRPKVNRWIEN